LYEQQTLVYGVRLIELFTSIKHSFFLMYLIIREKATVNIFFRTKAVPHIYYSATPKAECRIKVYVHWELKKIGSNELVICGTNELASSYEPCSPYEALGANKV